MTKVLVEAISAERTVMIPGLIIKHKQNISTMWTRDPHLIIKTLEGDMRASIGDWVIEGVGGELYPCKPDIFKKTYDEVL